MDIKLPIILSGIMLHFTKNDFTKFYLECVGSQKGFIYRKRLGFAFATVSTFLKSKVFELY